MGKNLIHDLQQHGVGGMDGNQNHAAAVLILLAQDLCDQLAGAGMSRTQRRQVKTGAEASC